MMWTNFFKHITTRAIVQGTTGAALAYAMDQAPLAAQAAAAFSVGAFVASRIQPIPNQGDNTNIESYGPTLSALIAHTITVQAVLTAKVQPDTAFLIAASIVATTSSLLSCITQGESEIINSDYKLQV